MIGEYNPEDHHRLAAPLHICLGVDSVPATMCSVQRISPRFPFYRGRRGGMPAWSMVVVILLFLLAMVYLSYGIFPSIVLVLAYVAILAAVVKLYRDYNRGFEESRIREEEASIDVSADDEEYERCPHCLCEITMKGTRWCPNCGLRLPWYPETPPISPTLGEAAEVAERENARRKRTPACIVCNLAIDPGDKVAYCPHCGNPAHRLHILEWLHVKGMCPACGEHLDEEELAYQLSTPPRQRRSKKPPRRASRSEVRNEWRKNHRGDQVPKRKER